MVYTSMTALAVDMWDDLGMVVMTREAMADFKLQNPTDRRMTFNSVCRANEFAGDNPFVLSRWFGEQPQYVVEAILCSLQPSQVATPNRTTAYTSVAAGGPTIPLSTPQRINNTRGAGPIIPTVGGGTHILGPPLPPMGFQGGFVPAGVINAGGGGAGPGW